MNDSRIDTSASARDADPGAATRAALMAAARTVFARNGFDGASVRMITAEAEVLSVHKSKPVTQLKIEVRRQDGEVVLEGEAWCYTFSGE